MSPRSQEKFETQRTASKKKITDSALDLFCTKGYSNTTVRMIAEEADVSLGLMYNYFKSKEEMLLHILGETSGVLASIFVDHPDPKIKFEMTIRNFITMLLSQKQKLRFLTQLGLDQLHYTEANTMTRNRYQASVAQFAEMLTAIGYTSSAKQEAYLLVATLDGLAFELLLMDDLPHLEQTFKHLINRYITTK